QWTSIVRNLATHREARGSVPQKVSENSGRPRSLSQEYLAKPKWVNLATLLCRSTLSVLMSRWLWAEEESERMNKIKNSKYLRYLVLGVHEGDRLAGLREPIAGERLLDGSVLGEVAGDVAAV